MDHFLHWLSVLWSNSSFAAFVGAFAAFALVMLTDYRRRKRTVRLLRSIIELDRAHAEKKLEQINRNIELLRVDNRVRAAPFMPFNCTRLKDLQFQVLDLLTQRQSLSLDALLYWMDAINGLLAEALKQAEELVKMIQDGEPLDTRQRKKTLLVTTLEESATNLKTFANMAESYVQSRFDEIVNLEHPSLPPE